MNKQLVYYGGEGYYGLPEQGDYSVKYNGPNHNEEIIMEFTNLTQAKKFFDKLQCGKALWYRIELIDAYTYE